MVAVTIGAWITWAGRESVSAGMGLGLSLLDYISVAVMTTIYSIENPPKLNTMMLLLTCDV